MRPERVGRGVYEVDEWRGKLGPRESWEPGEGGAKAIVGRNPGFELKSSIVCVCKAPVEEEVELERAVMARSRLADSSEDKSSSAVVLLLVRFPTPSLVRVSSSASAESPCCCA